MEEELPEQEEEIFEPLPEFGQIQGQTIKLSGLDYSLIKEENAKERKKDLLFKIKTKLGEFTHRMPVVESQASSFKTGDNDQLTKSIQLIASLKPAINATTFYLFPTQAHFAPLLPETITRRFGKMHTFPLFIRHSQQDVDLFSRLISKDDRIKQNRRMRQQEASKIVPELASQSDSDDIFGGSGSEEEEERPAIKIGQKLQLGVAEEDIFGGTRYGQTAQPEPEPEVVEKDKYEFLRKKVKTDQQGYDECYINNGPSLEEMKEYRKAGIQLFGDEKEFTQKERKYNVHKDYEKIKRIIDQKNKK